MAYLKDSVNSSLLQKGLNWDNPFDIPGNIAGGVSGGDLYADTRLVTGTATISLVGDSNIEIEYKLRLQVQDTIDFIPGGLGAGIEQVFTRPLSFLEQYDRAYDVTYLVNFNAKPVKESLTVPNLDCEDSDEPEEPDDKDQIERPTSIDPNDIYGPDGFGAERWIASPKTLGYTIRFENLETATAPAQQVTITHSLDPDLDWRSFQLGGIGWGGVFFEVPENQGLYYEKRFDLTAESGFLVDLVARINLATGTASWTFTTIDPATGDIPENPLVGFLPPNDETGIGDGFVTYTVRQDQEVQTGDHIDAQASIVFDTNEPIQTPVISNTIDVGTPSSTTKAIPGKGAGQNVNISMQGFDDGSGVASYDIYVSIDNSSYEQWLNDATGNSATYIVEPGHTYRFASAAQDNVGHLETTPTAFGNDLLRVGTQRKNRLVGGIGDDGLIGLGGKDRLVGKAGNDILNAGGGNDRAFGNAGRDLLRGHSGKDQLEGGSGNDAIEGGDGKDTLIGGAGQDSLFGGKARDVFVLEKGPKRDIIYDFKNGSDRLGLRGIDNADNLSILRKGRNTLIKLGDDQLALLQGVKTEQITMADFV